MNQINDNEKKNNIKDTIINILKFYSFLLIVGFQVILMLPILLRLCLGPLEPSLFIMPILLSLGFLTAYVLAKMSE